MVFVALIIIGLCVAGIFYLSTYLVDGLTIFSRKLKLSAFFVGTLILAIATSTPELVDVTISSIIGAGDLGVGDILGSSITNICLVLGLVAVINPIKRISRAQFKDALATLIISVLFLVLILDNNINRIDAVILLASFAVYHYLLHRKEISHGVDVFVKELRVPLIIIPLALFGIVLIGWIFINTSVFVAVELNIPLSVFGLTIVALSTSLPEIASSVTAAFEKHSKIALGNVFGSNITNFTFIVGLAALINPIILTSSFVFLFTLGFMIIVTIVMTYMTHKELDLNRKEGFVLLGAYLFYLVLLVMLS